MTKPAKSPPVPKKWASCKSHGYEPVFARVQDEQAAIIDSWFFVDVPSPRCHRRNYRLYLRVPVAAIVADLGSRLTALACTGEGMARCEPPARARSASVGATADIVKVKPNDFLDTPWNGSRERTHSAGRLVSGEKSAAA